MDNVAKAFQIHTSGHRANPQQRIKGESWPSWTENKKVTGNFEPAVLDHVGGKCICKHWRKTQWFPQDIIHSIDWEAHGQALKSSKIKH